MARKLRNLKSSCKTTRAQHFCGQTVCEPRPKHCRRPDGAPKNRESASALMLLHVHFLTLVQRLRTQKKRRCAFLPKL
jgi:hypothetical protein